MISVGLTSNRFCGKNRVSKIFSDIGVPVFDADVILKFILNYDNNVLTQIRNSIGDSIFNGVKLRSDKINHNIDEILDIVEPIIFKSYSKFIEMNHNKCYIIFKYSLLHERNLRSKMNFNISIFAPMSVRIERSDGLLSYSVTEMDIFDKNRLSDWVIHNYDTGLDIKETINKIDSEIVDSYFQSRINNKKNKCNNI